MRTSISAPNKASEDIKAGGLTQASGTGHHMKTAAKKCKYFIFCQIINYLFFFLFLRDWTKISRWEESNVL